MSKIIKGHYKNVTSKLHNQTSKCRTNAKCPMEGNCQVNDLIYKSDNLAQ